MTDSSQKPVSPNEKAKSGQLSLKQYKELKTQEESKKAKALRIPSVIQNILYIPLYLIALFGLIFIAYIIYSLITSPKPGTP